MLKHVSFSITIFAAPFTRISERANLSLKLLPVCFYVDLLANETTEF